MTAEAADPTELVVTPFGVYEVPGDAFVGHLRQLGGHQRPDVASMAALLRSGDAVLDVGAFIGTTAIPLAQRVGPSGHVTAFEAQPLHARLLQGNVERNGLQGTIEVVPAIVTSRVGPVFEQRLDISSATTWFSTEQGDGVQGTPLDTAAVTIDGYLRTRPDLAVRLRLIKIDVEGSEVDVLQGATSTIRRHRPALQLEVSRPQLQRQGSDLAVLAQFLRQHKYVTYLNLVGRDTPADEFELGRLADLRLLGDILTDVLALPREWPAPGTAQATLRVHARVGRVRARPLVSSIRDLSGRLPSRT